MLLLQRSFCFVILFISFAGISFSQIPKFNPFFFDDSLSQSSISTLQITAIGQYHYDREWNAGNIYLSNGDSLIAYYMRYDLVRNHLEVILGTKIMAINGSFINGFEWFSAERLKEEKFMSCNQYNRQDNINGFYQILVEGKMQLHKHKRIIELRDATSPTLVNDTDASVQAYETFFFAIDEKMQPLESKRKNLMFFDSALLSDYISKNRLKFNNENDLQKIVNYYNSIL